MIELFDTSTPEIEPPTIQLRRRYQQRKCLACGAKQRATPWSLFCAVHIETHRYCPQCETVMTPEAFGAYRRRCATCSRARALAHYHADPDRSKYRIRLRQMAVRSCTRSDQVLDCMRRRIALAALVKRTPGWTWEQRGQLVGRYGPQLATDYRNQCAGRVRDVDAAGRDQRKVHR
jgi:hypothetical protein